MRALIALFCLMTTSLTAFAGNYSEVLDDEVLLEDRIAHMNLMKKTNCLLDVRLTRDLVLGANERYVHFHNGEGMILKDLSRKQNSNLDKPTSCLMSFRNSKADSRSGAMKKNKSYSKDSLLILDEVLDVTGASWIEKRFGFTYGILLRGEEAGFALRCAHQQGRALTLKDLKSTLAPLAEVSMYCPGL